MKFLSEYRAPGDPADDRSRDFQLGFFHDAFRIRQDQELIDLLHKYKFSKAKGYGSVGYFRQFLNFVQDQPVDFCMFIINEPIDFELLCNYINHVIRHDMNSTGYIYLSVNKYLITARCYSEELSEDYDQAIKQFVEQRVEASIETYWACGLDSGNKFNWIHPLTRFFLKVDK